MINQLIIIIACSTPSVPYGLTTKTVTDTSIALHWKSSFYTYGCDIKEYEVRYTTRVSKAKEVQNSSNGKEVVVDLRETIEKEFILKTKSNLPEYTLMNLRPAVEYTHVHIFAINTVGMKSDGSEPLELVTTKSRLFLNLLNLECSSFFLSE